MTKDEALKLALEALGNWFRFDFENFGEVDYKAVAAIKEALAQRTWVGLTDEEREEIALEVPMDAVLITEAKLKEKNSA